MKKIYILLTALLITGLATQAQNRFDATIFGGLTFNQIDGDDNGGYGQMGLRGGVGTSFTLGEDTRSPWRMVVELAFTQKGSHINNGSFERSITLNYVELPLLFSYNMFDNKLRIAAGVAPGVLVGAQVIDNGSRNSTVEKKYLRFDWLPVTVGVRYMFTYNLAIEARYQTSMLNIFENASGSYRIFPENCGAFNRMISFCLSYNLFNQ